ncbi:MAG TPA: hypothetical protein VFI05_00685, partial [Nitrospiraceae bacterium]|nr:hypothetical protein [Nitrospiraceae bacterium]
MTERTRDHDERWGRVWITTMDNFMPSAQADGDVERYRTLLEVAESIARHVEVRAVIHDLAHRLPRVVQVNVIGLSLYHPERRVMRLHTI